MLKFKNNDQPIQKLWRDRYPGKLFMPISIYDLQFPKQNQNEYNLDLQLVLISTTDGCVYIFKLISDYELAAHISQQRDAGTGQKIWSYLAPVIPKNISSLTMTSSTVKVDLKEIKNVK